MYIYIGRYHLGSGLILVMLYTLRSHDTYNIICSLQGYQHLHRTNHNQELLVHHNHDHSTNEDICDIFYNLQGLHIH